MAISSNRFILTVVALLYLAAAIYLFMRWNASKRKIF
jgi:hypothetical protein